jgi:hypothetical protein
MTEPGILGIRLRPVGGVVLAMLGGAVLTALVLLLFYRVGGLTAVAPPVVLAGADLKLVSGHGEPTAAGLEIRQPGPQGLVAVQGVVERLVRARLYPRLSWQVEGLERDSELYLTWVTHAEPRTVRERSLPAQNEGAVDLGGEPRWQGRIAAIGLTVRGPLSRPLVVQRLELRPAALGPVELLRWAVGEWTESEDWSQRSINYTAGAPLDALFPPVLVVALWLGFSAALHAAVSPPRRVAGTWMPYTVLFLIGWLVLDLRWQWDLGRRLEQTVERFAGKDETGRRLAAPDGDLYRFLLEIRQRLPDKPARLFIVSADPGGGTAYQASRARYHLLPHNSYIGLPQPPEPGVARGGDYVLILSPLAGVRYHRAEQRLEWENQQLPAEMLYSAPAGALFRVLGGAPGGRREERGVRGEARG